MIRTPIAILFVSTLLACSIPQESSAYAGWTFTATYIINDVDNTISYTEAGSFNKYPVCSTAWVNEPPAAVPTTDPRHIVEIRFDTVLSRWVEVTQLDFVSTLIESSCPESTQLATPLPECSFATTWTPNTPIVNPLPPASGTIEAPNSRILEQTAVGQRVELERSLDLSYLQIQPKFAQGTVPFTGLLSFVDVTDEGQGRTGSMIAGRCVGPPSGGSSWNPGLHGFVYGASKGAPAVFPQAPGFGPIGSWSMWVDVCNADC